MTLALLQQLWLSGGNSFAHSCINCSPLLSHIAPALIQANVTAVQQAWFGTSCANLSAAAAPIAAAKKQKQPKQKQPQQPVPSKPDEAAQQTADTQLQLLKQQYQRSRMQEFYNNHLARELLLKLHVPSVNVLPRVKSIDLTINANDTHGRRYAEKWEMLLPALALEYITGKPATYVHSTLKYYRSRNAVTAVKVHLKSSEALEFLQKLVYIVLPGQNGFTGISSRALDGAGNLHFRVPKLINFPDFEEQFEIFENLQSLHVSVNLANTQGHKGRSQLLMSGLQLPMLAKKGEVLGEADKQQEVIQQQVVEEPTSESDADDK